MVNNYVINICADHCLFRDTSNDMLEYLNMRVLRKSVNFANSIEVHNYEIRHKSIIKNM